MNKGAIITLILTLLSSAIQAQSVFSDGSWFKLGVTETGIYKIDRDFMASVLGINVSNLDANTIKLYGFNGGLLPQQNSAPWYSDPPEIPMHSSGTADGSFDVGDYLLFFAQSPHKAILKKNGELDYEKNLYSDTAYYFLTFGGEQARLIETIENLSSGSASATINTFNDYITHEVDETNILFSGREWYGERFGSSGGVTSKNFNYTVEGIRNSIGVYTRLIGQSESPTSFDILLDQQVLGQVAIDSIPSVTSYSDFSRVRYTFRGTEQFGDFFRIGQASNNLQLTFRFNVGTASSSRAYIDYFILGFERNLRLYGNQTRFRSVKSAGNSLTYEVGIPTGNQEVVVWDITDPAVPKVQSFQKSAGSLTFTAAADSLVNEYIIFEGNDFPTPAYYGSVSNQNIKGKANVEGVVITVPEFLSEATRLASFHEMHDGLAVAVVTTRQIYNEFSSGRQDITAIRNYLKYLWENGNRLKYALLMGDASFDYKNRVSNNTNFVPVYESRQSLHRLYSHSSDDYYGFFEVDEGFWDEGILELYNGTRFPFDYTDHTLEIGIGRLPVKTKEEATDVVNKIIRYATSVNALGKWRTEAVYMADDGDGTIHMRQSETVNKIVRDGHPEIKVARLYLDEFNTVESMQNAFLDNMAEGALILDFLGHGSPSALMQRNEENQLKTVITIPLLSELKNRHRLPLFMTATCNFGQYDNPTFVSGGENMMLNPNGGVIALLTTTRAVFSSTNLLLNESFQEAVFTKQDGQYPRLGDVIRQAKNNSLAGPINRNFALIGDPMLMLNYPGYEIRFDKLESQADTVSALEKVTISGEIWAVDQRADNFEGTAIVTVLDIPREKSTLGLANNSFIYEEQSNALFRGEASVTNGSFQVSFIVPKNSTYNYKNGTITAYAFNDGEIVDAMGASNNFVLGGTASDMSDDDQAPTAQLYLNEPTFRNGDLVGPSSLFIANLKDESGINISTNGINQSIKLILNNLDPIILNDYYTANLDDYTQGTIVYPLQNLEPGYYVGELSVRDTYNNSSSWPIEFRVSDKPVLNLYDVINYPNPVPVSGSTTISFEHDRIGEELMIDFQVYDSKGSIITSRDLAIDDAPRKIDFIWDIAPGEVQGKGIYFFKIEVMSTLDGGRSTSVSRLIIK